MRATKNGTSPGETNRHIKLGFNQQEQMESSIWWFNAIEKAAKNTEGTEYHHLQLRDAQRHRMHSLNGSSDRKQQQISWDVRKAKNGDPRILALQHIYGELAFWWLTLRPSNKSQFVRFIQKVRMLRFIATLGIRWVLQMSPNPSQPICTLARWNV